MPFRKLAAVLLWLGVALAARLPAAAALPPPSSSCQRKCGDVDIPYPFGIGIEAESPDHCAMPGFFLTCDGTAGNNISKPFYGNVEVLGISLQHGQARVMNQISSYCYNTRSQKMDPASTWILNLADKPYRLSNTGNKFTVIGCRTLAYIGDQDNVGNKYMSGCVAMCRRGDVTSLTNGSCSGIGCCQTAIPSGLQYYQVWFDSGFNTTEIYSVSPCSYAVLMDSSNFTFLTSYVTSSEFNNTNDGGRAPLVLDWAVGNETCEVAQQKPESYACVSSNSECFNSPNGPGYICNCSKGFQGNPYLQDPEHGCRDINECMELPEYPCSVAGTCHNIPGGFKCLCPRGYPKGNAQNGTCERDQTLQLGEKLAIGAFACLLVGLTGFLGREVLHKRSIKRQALLRQRDKYFQQNGGQILSEIMKEEGNIQFTLYHKEQIELATNGFDKANIVGEGGQGTVYKAILDNNAVAIKRCKEVDESRRMDFMQELVILGRVNHPNIVKLLGCCLQFEAPMLVYEFVQNKTLQELLHHQRNKRCRVTLGTRLRIAAESAEALAHLHSLPQPILHGDVKPANILLGEGWVAKVSDFGCSTIDEKTQSVPKGTPGYLDPDYLLEDQLTDKNDVYSFGVVLLELLTGKKPLSKERNSLTLMFQESMGDGTLHELLDSDIVDEASMGVIRQVAVLASQCLVIPGTKRPAMSRVAEELRRLADQVQQHPQTPLVLERLSLAEMGSSTSSGYTESETTGLLSLEKKALSIEFAR